MRAKQGTWKSKQFKTEYYGIYAKQTVVEQSVSLEVGEAQSTIHTHAHTSIARKKKCVYVCVKTGVEE